MYKIFIGNVNFTTTEDMLRPIFAPHFEIADLVIAKDAAGKPRGFGFVMTKDAEKGRLALAKLGKPFVDGRRVYLKEAGAKAAAPAPRGPRGPRRSFGPRRPRPRPVGSGYVGGYSTGPGTPPPTASRPAAGPAQPPPSRPNPPTA